jgi:hypothetical protein
MNKSKRIKQLESEIIRLNNQIEILCGEDKESILRIKIDRMMWKTIEGEIFKGNAGLYFSMGLLEHL